MGKQRKIQREKHEFTEILLPRIKERLTETIKEPKKQELYKALYEAGEAGAKLDVILTTLHPREVESLLFGLPSEESIKAEIEIEQRMRENEITWTDSFFPTTEKRENPIEVHNKRIADNTALKELIQEKRLFNKAKKTLQNNISGLKSLKAVYLPVSFIESFNKDFHAIKESVKRDIEKALNQLDNYFSLKEINQLGRPIKGDISSNPSYTLRPLVKIEPTLQADRKAYQINLKIHILVNALWEKRDGVFTQNKAFERTAVLLKNQYSDCVGEYTAENVSENYLRNQRDYELQKEAREDAEQRLIAMKERYAKYPDQELSGQEMKEREKD